MPRADDLNLTHLRAFADVTELGSFSAAADRRNLTQPAVSLQVRQLERRLGVRLIERVGRRATPTAAGLELLTHARHIDAIVHAALEGMARHASGVGGRIRLGTGGTACIYLLPPILRELRRRLPSLEIVVSTGNTPDVLRSLEENTTDVALVTLPAPGRTFDVIPLLDDELVAVAGGGRQVPKPATARRLSNEPMILYDPGGHTRRVVDDWFTKAGVRIKPVMELGSVEAIKELAAVGLGVAVLPQMAFASSASRAPFTMRSLTPKLHRTLGVVVRRDKLRSAGLRAMIAALQAQAK